MAKDCGKVWCVYGAEGVAGTQCCTFEHLYIITSFALDVANSSQTRHTFGRHREDGKMTEGYMGTDFRPTESV